MSEPNGNSIWTKIGMALLPLGVMGLVGFGALNSDTKALAQRVEKAERVDEKTAETLDKVKGDVSDLKAEGRAIRAEQERQGRQLDRIEQLVRGQSVPPAPTFGTRP